MIWGVKYCQKRVRENPIGTFGFEKKNKQLIWAMLCVKLPFGKLGSCWSTLYIRLNILKRTVFIYPFFFLSFFFFFFFDADFIVLIIPTQNGNFRHDFHTALKYALMIAVFVTVFWFALYISYLLRFFVVINKAQDKRGTKSFFLFCLL